MPTSNRDSNTRLEILERDYQKRKAEKITQNREKRAFWISFCYISISTFVMFTTLAIKHSENWKNMLLTGIYIILILFLLLDSKFGGFLIRGSMAYNFLYPNDDSKTKELIGSWLLMISLMVITFIFMDALDQFIEIFYTVVLLFLLMLIVIIQVFLGSIANIILFPFIYIPLTKNWMLRSAEWWKRRSQNTKQIIKMIPVTIAVNTLLVMALYFLPIVV